MEVMKLHQNLGDNWAKASLPDAQLSEVEDGFLSFHLHKREFPGSEVVHLQKIYDAGKSMLFIHKIFLFFPPLKFLVSLVKFGDGFFSYKAFGDDGLLEIGFFVVIFREHS